MKTKSRQSGLTLVEMTTVVAIVALLTAFALPVIRTFFDSLGSAGSVKGMISAALASARAIAAKDQRYAGVRFQKAYHEDDQDSQYMILIVNEEPRKMGNLTIGFRAIEGIQPIKLPGSIGVMDLIVRTNHGASPAAAQSTSDRLIAIGDLDDTNPVNLDPSGRNIYVTDTTAFSIIFSPTGKMVLHDVRTRNRDGDFRPVNLNNSMDDVFNSPVNIETNNTGMFVQDDYAHLGLGGESSRNRFVIYDKIEFDKMNGNTRYSYLYSLDVIYINPYTGTIVSAD